MTSRDTCGFLPPWLVERVAGAGQVAHDEALRERRATHAATVTARAPALAPGPGGWQVHDAGNRLTLPGTPVRGAGEPETGDVAVDEAAAGIEATLAMFAEGLGRDSYDDAGARVDLTVHYGKDYVNAFWDGSHLVFGDGDGRVFERFTKPVDVLAHEFAHAVTEHTAGLVYRGQPGALNESVSDVFAACLKQRLLGQDAGDADWLIGEGLFTDAVSARALRDMAAPGTAYDDPELGSDPQVGHMDDYVVTSQDNGGVHLNSGIPNRAFQLAATAIGGSTLEGAGTIWYAALTGGDVRPTTDFAGFAAATVVAAGEHADAVRAAWEQVGVVPDPRGADGPAVPDAVPVGAPAVVRVRRTGGFAGMTTDARVDLTADDPGLDDVRRLAARVDPAQARGGQPMPDMFVFEFHIGDAEPFTVPEQQLTPDLAELARRVLERADDSV
jgi:Zn-dependent metalloprotease